MCAAHHCGVCVHRFAHKPKLTAALFADVDGASDATLRRILGKLKAELVSIRICIPPVGCMGEHVRRVAMGLF